MKNLSILVVDDDPVIRRLLEERLKNAEYRVMVAEDGYQAEAFLKQEHFDVVLTDLVMPGDIGGIEVLEITKEIQPDTEVVLITAHSSVDTAVAAMKKGAADYLEKPINFDELLLRMEKITNLKNILRNAQDLGQAMTVTETEAASTIQDLEMRVTKIQAVLDQVETILQNDYDSEDVRIQKALGTLAEQ
ncbi:response regulator [Desulfopila sp. IMCC35008]|uniref:response regulator n=1 Tax=Desulfopila sp. IMCC35008 TaxID=2653858 RepID=UPI0013D68E9F|nr:response regulator [Desulfopila sp. IMCC35008]